jgi:surfeit locus 1 family protein
MSPRLSAFGRVFAPSWPMTLATLVLLASFVSLGRWQWQRGVEKEALWQQFERAAPARETTAGALDALPRFARVALRGAYRPERQFLLENRPHAGRPGYEVLTPFDLQGGGTVLVNRGWLPFTGYRDRLPDVSMQSTGLVAIEGRIDELPSAGLSSGRAPPPADAAWPRLTSFPAHEELEAALDARLVRRIVLLDAQAASGYVREWSPPGLAPSRHLAYAIQWWGFAVLLLVLYFGLNFRKVP